MYILESGGKFLVALNTWSDDISQGHRFKELGFAKKVLEVWVYFSSSYAFKIFKVEGLHDKTGTVVYTGDTLACEEASRY